METIVIKPDLGVDPAKGLGPGLHGLIRVNPEKLKKNIWGSSRSEPSSGQEHPTGGTGRWFPPPSSVTLVSEVNLLRRIYCCAIWNAKLSRMVVWVLRRIYRCIILNVNCYELLYEYYEGSIVILCWRLFVTSVYISIVKDLLLCYT